MKKLQKAFDDLNPEAFIERCREKTSDQVYRLIQKNISNNKFYITYGNRKPRNNFIEKILENEYFLSSNKEAHALLKEKSELVEKIEQLFDEIKESLPKCHASTLPAEVQCWSHIERAILETRSISHKASEKIEEHYTRNQAPSILLEAIVTEDEDGNKINADTALSNISELLSLELKLNAFQFKWIKNDKIILPKRVPISDEDIFKSGSIQLYAMSWSALEDIATRALSFGGRVREITNNELPPELQSDKFKNKLIFDSPPSEDEIFDYIANRRLTSKTSQNLLEITHKLANSIRHQSIHNLQEVADEILTTYILEETLHHKISEDNQLYHGLKLTEWASGYRTLKIIAKEKEKNEDYSLIEHEELVRKLRKSGIRGESIETLIHHLSFGKDSRDLFDTPLIKTEENNYLLIPSLFSANSTAITLLSRLASLEVTFDKKGKSFERATIEFMQRKKYTCKPLKFKINRSEFEYDAILKIDNHLFILECKNTSISGNNPTQAKRYSDFICKTVDQANRLADGLRRRPDIIKKEFDLDPSSTEIIPVILNCLPYSRPPAQGVYISDFSAFTKFFNTREISSFTHNNGTKVKMSTLFNLWTGQSPSAEELIRYLETPPQITEAAKYLTYLLRPRPTSETSLFFSAFLETDEDSRTRDYQNLIQGQIDACAI